MARKYVVLWGKRGMSPHFRTPQKARTFAKEKAGRLGKRVAIDQITTYPRARPGMVDWSQRHYTYVNPKNKIRRAPAKRVVKKITGRRFQRPSRRPSLF